MIITSSPCLPKEKYHIGNAISAICVDLITNYNIYVKKVKNVVSVPTPWNLHGLPYETIYERLYSRKADYEGVLDIAKINLNRAIEETRLFIPVENRYTHIDVQKEFVDYTKECFAKLIEKHYVTKWNSEYCLDISKILNENDCERILAKISYTPRYLYKSIYKQGKTFNSYYPMTKMRAFSVSIENKDEMISLNPIFQSLIYPNYLIEKYGGNTVDFFVSSTGFSMNKWHFLRQLVSIALTERASISCIISHGVIMGSDGKPMSKHSPNCISPSELKANNDNHLYLRYILIRTLSFNNISIDLEKYTHEFNSIENKLMIIENKKELYPVKSDKSELLNAIEVYLSKSKFSVALETFYVYLRSTSFSKQGCLFENNRVHEYFNVFFGEMKCQI